VPVIRQAPRPSFLKRRIMNDAAQSSGVSRIQKPEVRTRNRSDGFHVNLILRNSSFWLLDFLTIGIKPDTWSMIIRGKPRGIEP
jgi:hypothetical protein